LPQQEKRMDAILDATNGGKASKGALLWQLGWGHTPCGARTAVEEPPARSHLLGCGQPLATPQQQAQCAIPREGAQPVEELNWGPRLWLTSLLSDWLELSQRRGQQAAQARGLAQLPVARAQSKLVHRSQRALPRLGETYAAQFTQKALQSS